MTPLTLPGGLRRGRGHGAATETSPPGGRKRGLAGRGQEAQVPRAPGSSLSHSPPTSLSLWGQVPAARLCPPDLRFWGTGPGCCFASTRPLTGYSSPTSGLCEELWTVVAAETNSLEPRGLVLMLNSQGPHRRDKECGAGTSLAASSPWCCALGCPTWQPWPFAVVRFESAGWFFTPCSCLQPAEDRVWHHCTKPCREQLPREGRSAVTVQGRTLGLARQHELVSPERSH